MQVSVSARHMEISEAVKEFAEKKVANLDRLSGDLTQIEIILDASDGGHCAELIAHPRRGEKFVAEGKAADMYQAIATVIDKMDHQLRKKNQKLKQHRKKGAKGVMLPEKEEEAGTFEESDEFKDDAEREDL